MGSLTPPGNGIPNLAEVVWQNTPRQMAVMQEKATTNVFEETVSLRVVEGAGNGDQGHVLLRVILDEEVDDISLSINHVCRCRSVSLRGLGRGG